MINRKAIISLFEKIARESNDAYRHPDEISVWTKVGHALAKVSDSSRHVYEIAHEMLEDWNYHAQASIIRWLGRGANYTLKYYDLEYLCLFFNDVWVIEDKDGRNRQVNITVNIEYIDEEK